MQINEENFITQLIQRNEKALDYVVDNYACIINTIVKKHLYNLQSYQDECINDVFLSIWNNIESFDSNKSTFRNWVGAISKYKTIDYRRKYGKYMNIENIDEIDIKSKENVHEEVTKNELSLELENLLSNLSIIDKRLFIKLYVEGREVEDISVEMNLNKSSIYNRVSKGKKTLRKLFQK